MNIRNQTFNRFFKFAFVASSISLATFSAHATLVIDPANAASTGTVTLSVDNYETAYFNGSRLGSSSEWTNARTYNFVLQPGTNVLAVEANDVDGVAALIAQLNIGSITDGSGTHWKVSTQSQPGWETQSFDDSSWSNATSYGNYGTTPWETRVDGLPSSTQANWIWSNDNENHDRLYFRLVIENTIPDPVGVPPVDTPPQDTPPTVVASRSMTWSGQLVAQLPQVQVTSTPDPTSHVEYTQLSIDTNAGPCDLVINTQAPSSTYIRSEKPVCVLEYYSDSLGFPFDSLDMNAVLTSAGTRAINYRVLVVNNGQSHIILDSQYPMDIASPVPTVITSATSRIGTQSIDGFDLFNYDKRRSLANITVHVEQRSYDQLVDVDGNTCTVEEGDTNCELRFTDYIPGLAQGNLNGTDTLTVNASDALWYTTPHEQPININYDYRPPELLDFIANASPSNEPITHSVDGMDFEIPRNQGLLVVQTPHFLREDEWWIPSFGSLTFVPEEITEQLPTSVVVNGREVPVPSILTSYRPQYNLRPEPNPDLISDKMIFMVDLANLPDGRYEVSAVVEDDFSNSSSYENIEKLIDRNEPLVFGILNGNMLSDNDKASTIFLSDFHVYVASGWNDGTTLQSVTIDGSEVGFTELDKHLFNLNEAAGLQPGQSYDLGLTVSDDAGHLTTRTFDLNYGDASFNLYTRASQVFAGIQSLDISLSQQYGQRCQFTTSAELAVEISGGTQFKGCTIDQSSIPNGLNVNFNRRSVTMDGVLEDIGNHQVGFDVVYHNYNGATQRFPTNVIDLEAIPAGDITLELLERNRVGDDLYAIPHNSRFATDFTLDYMNAEIALDISASGNTDSRTLPQSRRTQPVTRKVRVNRVDGSNSDVWSTIQYQIDAAYAMQPSSKVSKVFDVLVTPTSSTRAFLEIDDTSEYTTQDTITFEGSVGAYDRSTRSNLYIPETMGDWEAYLAIRDGNQFVPINSPQPIDSQGKVNFTVSGETLFQTSRQFFMIARSLSNYPQFDMEVRSNSANLEILKADALEGQIRARRVEARIPFDTSIFFDFKTNEDERVAGDFEWQRSTDGNTWSTMTDLTNRKRINLSIDDVGKTKYRVAMRNNISGIDSYSEEIEIAGYEVAEIRLVGPTNIYTGLSVDYEVQIPDSQYDEGDGVIEWSLDGGSTWTYGQTAMSLTPTENLKLGARYRLNTSSDIDNEDTYSTKFLNIRVRDPRPLSLSFATPRSVEVGYEGQFTGTYRPPYRDFTGNVSEVIVLPDGTRVDASSLTYIPIASDIVSGKAEFTYAAWIDGLENETYAEVTREVSAYDYQFNMPDLNISQRYQITPTPVYATVTLDVDNPAPGITYDYDWDLEEDGIDLIQDSGNRVRFDINSHGNKLVGVTVSDNRGNEAEVTQILTVREPQPMEIELSHQLNKRYATVPASVTVRSKYVFDHPRDFPVSMNWYLNGELIAETTNSRYNYQVTDPGDHEFEVRVESQFGQVGTETMLLNIGPNIPPYCDPNVDDRGTKIVISPNCRDDDGNIVATFYSWQGQQELRGYSRISFNKAEFPTNTVTLRTVDNGGEEVIDVVSW